METISNSHCLRHSQHTIRSGFMEKLELLITKPFAQLSAASAATAIDENRAMILSFVTYVWNEAKILFVLLCLC